MANSSILEIVVLVFVVLSLFLTALGCCAIVYIDWHNNVFKFAKDFFDFFPWGCDVNCIIRTTGISFTVCVISGAFFAYKKN